MRKKGFTLIEMILYIALFSFLGITISLLYTEVQKFFTYSNIYMERFVVRRYITLVAESKLDFIDPNCLKASVNVSCKDMVIIDSSMFQRLSYIGDVEKMVFTIAESVLTVSYDIEIGRRVFSEQVQIYLI